MADVLPDWVTYPETDWIRITPEQAGLDRDGFETFLSGLDVKGASFGGEDHTGNRWGTVLTRGGYLVHAWGDPSFPFQTASTGKALIWVLIGLAVKEGLLDPEAPIHRSWSGEGQLTHPHKLLNRGHHKALTWRHVLGEKGGNHQGGFPMELGNEWSRGRLGRPPEEADRHVPEWANWTGDPFLDLYAHVAPGTTQRYSSAGFWRLGQALTAAWDRDLKEVLDERLFSVIGVPTNRWAWYTGRSVAENRDFYPTIPDSYTYLDPPFEINGHAVRSGPGWVEISASDLARFGHLLATGGIWKGRRVMDSEWLRGHAGGNRSGVSGEHTHVTAMGMVTTEGIDHPHSQARSSYLPAELFTGPVRIGAKEKK